ncbi:MAG: helix-turn-helix domain-containing protein [Bacteroidetes bacterium]|nr:MAG: helix-turn-helix domain-containing protein [Bacteroidota bacterium]
MKNGDIFNPYGIFLSLHIPNSIAKSKLLSSNDKLLYGRLLQYAGKNGIAFPKQETIAVEIGISCRQVKRSIRKLMELKLISIVRENEDKLHHRCNKYYFLWNEMFEDKCQNVPSQGDTSGTSQGDTSGTSTEENHKEENHIKKDTCFKKAGNLKKGKMNTKYDNIKKEVKEETKNILVSKNKRLNTTEIFSIFNSSLEDKNYPIIQRSLTAKEQGLIKSLRLILEKNGKNTYEYIIDSVHNWDYIREKLDNRVKKFPTIKELCWGREDILSALSTIKKPVYVVDDRPLGITVVYRRENELPRNITKEYKERLIYQMQENGEVEVTWPMK